MVMDQFSSCVILPNAKMKSSSSLITAICAGKHVQPNSDRFIYFLWQINTTFLILSPAGKLCKPISHPAARITLTTFLFQHCINIDISHRIKLVRLSAYNLNIPENGLFAFNTDI
jgi:hypothetical protein